MSQATVATVIFPAERPRVEAAGEGCFAVIHSDNLDEASFRVRRGAIDALFLSVHRCGDADVPRVARFVREFPDVPAVALVSRRDDDASERVLRLGRIGVRSVVDLTAPAGWQRLRDLVREPNAPFVAATLAVLDRDLREAPDDCRLFFELVIRRSDERLTAWQLARDLRVAPTSLMTRFLRAGLPSPKTYISRLRILRAAWMFQNGGVNITDVSVRLGYSTPQCFGRHVRSALGMTAGEYRRRFPYPVALERFRATLLAPYRDRLRTFHPLGTLPGDLGRPAARRRRIPVGEAG